MSALTEAERDRLARRIAQRFESHGEAWMFDGSGDLLAGVAADEVAAFVANRDEAWRITIQNFLRRDLERFDQARAALADSIAHLSGKEADRSPSDIATAGEAAAREAVLAEVEALAQQFRDVGATVWDKATLLESARHLRALVARLREGGPDA